MYRNWLLVAPAIGLSPTAASAQTPPANVSAAAPDGIVAAMTYAGYLAELSKDGVGDPMIETELAGWPGYIYFYGCQDETNDNCQSVRLSVGFDRKTPMDPKALNTLASDKLFASFSLDEEGDPYVAWDIVTGDGIPAAVFFKSLDNFSWMIDDVSQTVFENDE
ncbi:YbjN domain-containing protein [Qipengyuania atrilutea]|uniref:YbjN domain-containing protein n=1 Tax=Qipengyuania atrilutea TaxID=2744473 RepID=A0A850H4F5_9SPHN|nr:YbjN domain-containing protein [Actirhodobacter atriluteus]NVD43985.1 YbjN domain-containing protein [Actirhodobacter atriluteus]